MDAIKFVVLDEEDLEVASTHLQDAVVKVSDVLWRPREKRVVVALNRFDWENTNDPNHEYHRRRAALRFERVLSCKCREVDPARKDAVLNLLAVSFDEADAPAGTVTLMFSGGATLKLEVECLRPNSPIWGHPGPPPHARLMPVSTNRRQNPTAPDLNPRYPSLACGLAPSSGLTARRASPIDLSCG